MEPTRTAHHTSSEKPPGPKSPLSTLTVVAYLVQRGLLAGDGESPVTISPLGGGVSSVVLLVEAGQKRIVVKQPRTRLQVEKEWYANPDRVLSEAKALQLVRRSTPQAVPALLDIDRRALAITMTAAPAGWRTWKDLLLEGVVDAAVGRQLGALLATWHVASSDWTGLEDVEVFEQLRIDPFHRTVAVRYPDLAKQIGLAIEALLGDSSRRCFVHGDFSPKNVLVGDDSLWIIDFEVAHAGNPLFDLAFLVTHLLLKSLHRPSGAAAYRLCAIEFLKSYEEVAGRGFAPADESLGLQVGCLLLARVDGKSPAEYLTKPEQNAARRLGASLVGKPKNPLTIWPSLDPWCSR